MKKKGKALVCVTGLLFAASLFCPEMRKMYKKAGEKILNLLKPHEVF